MNYDVTTGCLRGKKARDIAPVARIRVTGMLHKEVVIETNQVGRMRCGLESRNECRRSSPVSKIECPIGVCEHRCEALEAFRIILQHQ